MSLLLCRAMAAVYNVLPLLATPLELMLLLLCPLIVAVSSVRTLVAAPPKNPGFASGTKHSSVALARQSVMAATLSVVAVFSVWTLLAAPPQKNRFASGSEHSSVALARRSVMTHAHVGNESENGGCSW